LLFLKTPGKLPNREKELPGGKKMPPIPEIILPN
jgi:hypothetical protein